MNNSQQKAFFQRCLYDALLNLMEAKPLPSISIGELCNAAGVSRMTYYRSYEHMEDILLQHLDSCFSSFMLDVAEVKDDLEKIIMLFFSYIGEEEDRFFRCLASSTAVHLLNDRFYQYISELITLIYPDQHISPYIRSYLAGGSYRIVVDWLQNGQDESCEAMTQILLSLIGCLRHFETRMF